MMRVLLFLLGKSIRLASAAAFLYLIWGGHWRVILLALAFSFVTPMITALLNWPMSVFWRSLGYPDSLTTPGLSTLVNPVRLTLVYRIPQFVYGGLAFGIGVGAFILFGSGSHTWERAAFLMAGFDAAYTVPTVMAMTLKPGAEDQGMFLSSQLLYAKMSFLALLIVHAITSLVLWQAVVLLALGMAAQEIGFEIAAWRRSITGLT
jgi:hypothetical protein